MSGDADRADQFAAMNLAFGAFSGPTYYHITHGQRSRPVSVQSWAGSCMIMYLGLPFVGELCSQP